MKGGYDMQQLNSKIKARIEKILSRILSDKYQAKVLVKFRKGKNQNGNKNKTGNIEEEQILSE
jgi:hypothetical protein